MGYVVTSALVAVNGSDGKIKYLYSGTPVPADVAKADLDRLEADGLIEKVAAEKAPTSRAKADG